MSDWDGKISNADPWEAGKRWVLRLLEPPPRTAAECWLRVARRAQDELAAQLQAQAERERREAAVRSEARWERCARRWASKHGCAT